MNDDPAYLITGGTGFLGALLAYKVLQKGGRPWVLVRPRERSSGWARFQTRIEGMEKAFGRKVDLGRASVLEGDITLPRFGLGREQYEEAASHADAVIHAAALLSFDEKKAAELDECNVMGTNEVLRFCREAGCDLHHVSTAFVCGAAEGAVEESYSEPAPSFRNTYERTKWMAEGAVFEAVSDGGLKASVYRPSIIMGDRTRGYTSVFQTLYRWFYAVELLARQEARRTGNGSPVNLELRFPVSPDGIMSVVPVDYVADALLHIARTEEPEGRIYHLVTQEIPRNNDHLNLVLKSMEVKGITLYPPEALPEAELTRREQRILNAVADYRAYFDCRVEFLEENTARALKGSGIEPPRVDQDYIDRIIGFAREMEWGRRMPQTEPDAPAPSQAASRAFFTRHLEGFKGRKILPDLKHLDADFNVFLSEPRGMVYSVRIEDARITAVGEGTSRRAEFSFHVPVRIFLEITAGREDPREAFFAGKTDIRGDLEKALAIIPVLKRFFEEYPYAAPAD